MHPLTCGEYKKNYQYKLLYRLQEHQTAERSPHFVNNRQKILLITPIAVSTNHLRLQELKQSVSNISQEIGLSCGLFSKEFEWFLDNSCYRQSHRSSKTSVDVFVYHVLQHGCDVHRSSCDTLICTIIGVTTSLAALRSTHFILKGHKQKISMSCDVHLSFS